jgi:hypothetical protein
MLSTLFRLADASRVRAEQLDGFEVLVGGIVPTRRPSLAP